MIPPIDNVTYVVANANGHTVLATYHRGGNGDFAWLVDTDYGPSPVELGWVPVKWERPGVVA